MDNLVTSNIRQRPIRTLVCVAGVALGVILVMLFTGLARGMSNDLSRRASNVRAELIFMRPGALQLTGTSMNLDVRYADRLKGIDGVEDAIPIGRYFIQGKGGFGLEQIDGVDWNAYARMNGIQIMDGQSPTGNSDVMIDSTKARTSNLHIGSVLTLFGNNQQYRVSGIYSPESGPRIKLTLPGLQEALEANGKATFIFVKLRNSNDVDAMAAKINAELPGNTIQPTREVFAGFENSIPYLGVFLRVLVGLAAIVSALVVMLAMYTTITERTREIGILKAMGASRGYIVGIIEKEAILISVIGLIAGFGISALAGYGIHKVYGLVFEYSWQWAVTAAVIGLVGGVLGALYPAWKASSLDPVNALAYD
jgi:putative ABC transport system permease protein